jgi:iron complex outermembrane receptor protein
MQLLFNSVLLISGLLFFKPAPEGYVKGKVFDKNTQEPLTGVYVIYGKNLGTTTSPEGFYFFKTAPGKLSISFQSIGYISVIKEVIIPENDTFDLDIGMEMKVREIDQVVISANKTEQRIAELSVSMDIIKTSFLSDNQITDAQELINKSPGIEVMDGQASVRGGSGYSYGAGSRVLVLIDGLPMVSADAGNIKWQFLPLENLSQVEIIKGASSVLYGSSALNGVINFRTADASNIPETQFYTEAGIYGKPLNRDYIWWDTPRVFSSASFSHLQKFGKTDFGISSNLLVDEGYRRLNGEKLARVNLKLKHFSAAIEGLAYGLNLNTGYNVKKDFIIWENADLGALKQSPSTAVEFHGTFITIDPFITLKKSNSYQHDLRMRIQTSLNKLPESERNNSNAYSYYSEYQGWFRLLDFMDMTAGVTGNYSAVNSNFFGDHNSLNLAGYSQFEFRPVSRLKAVAGIRLEYNSLDGIKDKLVPVFRTGLNWQAADYTYLRASFGQGYRFPSMAEKFAATTLGSIIIIPNPDLLSESGWNTELGVKQGISFGKMTGQADLSLFYMRSNNLIEFMFGYYEGEGMGFRATNREDSRIYGTEAEFVLAGPVGTINTSFSGGYTFIYPVEVNPYTNKNTDIFLKYRRKHLLKTSVTADWKKLTLRLNVYFSSKILNIDEVFLTTPILPGFDEYWPEHNTAYGLADLSLGYRLNETYRISFTVKNLTNTEYMGRPGDIQPQRNYSVRFTGKF